jgi:hypothetical protein
MDLRNRFDKKRRNSLDDEANQQTHESLDENKEETTSYAMNEQKESQLELLNEALYLDKRYLR